MENSYLVSILLLAPLVGAFLLLFIDKEKTSLDKIFWISNLINCFCYFVNHVLQV